ncbi:alpha/beta hydrolase [Segetibacter sp. 3557_3]|uniref:alpha/beta hydrolase-fold protein n=1 Tax=Segetibacter sp. 3557_3 TaxID=2547429 RepID=UPI001058D36F|nr:alpha/beta hydrolase-fold protein [Segetibacter sp. 3557_3]TDH28949.1 alpha/beta hydrolase [Segetibacter sp. 3557_3]
MRFFLILLFISFVQPTIAQYTLRLVVNEAATRQNETFYASGSFNNWSPNDPAYLLKPYGTKRKAVVLRNIPAGTYTFKFTRGSWEKVETAANGSDIENREVKVTGDTTVAVSVAGWKDDFPVKPKRFTATPQVKLLDSAFKIPQLNRSRRIWIYLPRSYASSKKSYPVIYMHDGQNLFNEQTAGSGEWGVDEALDSLQLKTGKEAIVVGIDHGGDKRMNEYNPYDTKEFGKGEGDLYLEFLTATLKPFIDKQYRTLTGPVHTYIAGSSMGGLISFYAIVKYPNVFGGAGIFSPSFAVAPAIYEAAQKATWTTVRPKLFFYAGGQEGPYMVPDMKKMVTLVQSKQSFAVRDLVSPLNKHNERAWREEFPNFYKWIMQ